MHKIWEIITLSVTFSAFWFHSPPIRDNWVWLLVFALLFGVLRLWRTRTHPHTRYLWGVFLLLFILMMFNYQAAPFRRADFWVLVCRPLFGFWLVLFCWEHGQTRPHSHGLWWVTAGAGVFLGVLGLTATQWTGKSQLFAPIIDLLPRFNYRALSPDLLLSFNPNEIGGVLALCCPLLLGLAFVPHFGRGLRGLCLLGATLTGIAALFGMSRFGLFGITEGTLLLLFFAVRNKAWRWGIGAGMAIGVVAFIALFALTADADLPGDASLLSVRDSNSVTTRLQMWESSLAMASDYPLTGVGMSMFRYAIRLPAYQVPYFESIHFTAPHAHNALAQWLADFGFVGAGIILVMCGGIGVGLYTSYRRADTPQKPLIIAVCAGLLAYTLYHLGDTITWWDRFAFAGWWGVGLASAIFVGKST